MQSRVKQGKIPAFKDRFQSIVESYGGQTEFANKSGISRQTIGFWYNGDRVPNAEMLIGISKCCHVSVDYLLGLTECASNSTDIRAVCDYTGLSEKAVENLHFKREIETGDAELIDKLLDIPSKQAYIKIGNTFEIEPLSLLIENEVNFKVLNNIGYFIASNIPESKTGGIDVMGNMIDYSNGFEEGREKLLELNDGADIMSFRTSELVDSTLLRLIGDGLTRARETWISQNKE